MVGLLFYMIGVAAVAILGIGFFTKRRMLLLAGWLFVIAAVGAGAAGL